jgi:hypothetical protein
MDLARVAGVAAAGAVILLAGCGATTGSGAAASCVGPTIAVTPSTFAAGDAVRVRGQWLFADCYDTGQRGMPPPLKGVELRLETSGNASTSFLLATVDADPTGRIDVPVRIPVGVPAGNARVATAGGGVAAVVVTAH